jgi:hypothetical protein
MLQKQGSLSSSWRGDPASGGEQESLPTAVTKMMRPLQGSVMMFSY